MFYALKVIEQLIMPPGLFILIALVLAGFIYRSSRPISATLVTFTAFIYLLCLPVVGNALIRPLENAYPQPTHVHGDVIVVLGGGFTVGTTDVTGEGNLIGDSSSRLVTAAMLYRQLHVPVLLSGGPSYIVDGTRTSEAQIGARELISIGIPSHMILTESTSRNTQENALFSKPILIAHHLHHPILVTSAYHMRRAVMDFHHAGIAVTPYPTAYYASRPTQPYDFTWLPSSQGVTNIAIALKEYVGLIATTLGVHG